MPPFRGKARLGRLLAPAPDGLAVVGMRDGTAMTVDGRSSTERDVYWTGDYADREIRELARMLPPDPVVLDVGANIGFFTVGLAHAAGARVYAFEPMPRNVERLRENVDGNGFAARVVVTQTALGDAPGELWLAPEPGGASTGNAGPSSPDAAGAVRVRVRTLDHVAADLGIQRCDLVKVDVEGAELAVLRGGAELLRRSRPLIYVELNPYWMAQLGWAERDLFELVGPWGYELRRRRLSGSLENVLLIPRA